MVYMNLLNLWIFMTFMIIYDIQITLYITYNIYNKNLHVLNIQLILSYRNIPCYAMLCYVMLCYILYYIILHYITLHFITLHYITLYYIILYYIILYYIILYYIKYYVTVYYDFDFIFT